MNATTRSRPESDKGAQRRQQVLDAATECFRREGFHGSSIARISQAAGMSPGHIYHYFANKEAIVEAIAEREEHDMAELVRKLEQDHRGGDLVARLTRHTAETVDRNSDPAHVGLMLELGAEAARNPAVAKILRCTDQAIAAQFLDLAARVGVPAGLDDAELRLRMEMIATLFQGLALRSLVDPERDRPAAVRMVDDLIRFLLGERR
jgi:TetR/AcrR family transcriptional repressor of uid operon